jgi:hypothetical protein
MRPSLWMAWRTRESFETWLKKTGVIIELARKNAAWRNPIRNLPRIALISVTVYKIPQRYTKGIQ